VQIDVSYGSSGKLYGQLKHSAPYSLFLSADHKRPQLLHEQGICALPFHYTSGQVVLWSKDMTIQAATWQEALQQAKGKIAMASPDAAPYGEKAFDVLTRTGVFNVIAPQLTYGQSVGQTFLFATSGGAELGFIALSQALSEIGQKGQYWSIPEAQVVEQWGCIPHHAPRAKVAQELQDFLLSPPAQQISQIFGYLSEK
jgi:molybdate transport system substrate-binding protein